MMMTPMAGVQGARRVARAAWLADVAIGLVLLLAFLDLPNYLAALNPDFQPKRLYFLMAGVCVVHLAVSRRFSLRESRPGLLMLLLVYMLVNVMHAALGTHVAGSDAAREAWFRIQIVVLSILLAWSASTLSAQTLARLFAGCALLVALTVAFDFVVPGVLYPHSAEGAVPGRAAGILVNSTRTGEVLILTTLLALPVLDPRRRLWLMLIVGASVLMTLSRGAITIWILVYVALAASAWLPRASLGVLATLIAVMLSSAGLLVAYQASLNPAADVADLSQRLGFFSGDVPTDDSAVERTLVFIDGLKLFAQNWLFGAGVGATQVWQHAVGPHNQFVLMAAEYGLIGALGWLGLIVFVVSGGYFGVRSLQWVAAAVVVLFSGLMHGMLDFPFWIVALMLIASRPHRADFSSR
ncbi:MAG: O-antigen ligase family protein [Burkholderiaceae bacterium]